MDSWKNRLDQYYGKYSMDILYYIWICSIIIDNIFDNISIIVDILFYGALWQKTSNMSIIEFSIIEDQILKSCKLHCNKYSANFYLRCNY